MEIYEPQEDSYLLSDYVKKYAFGRVLDVGCGSGIQSESALKLDKVMSVTGVDINQKAVDHCKTSKYCKGCSFIKSDLFETLDNKKFDTIIFNPPYLSDQDDPEEIKDYTTGGKNGYEIINRFFSEVADYLADGGIILIVFSSETKKEKVDSIISKHLFEYELLEEKGLFYERLYCYKVIKSELLNKLNYKGIDNISFLAKGKRGIVYKARYSDKNSVVKITDDESDAKNSIIFESKWLSYVNRLGIGPKLYYSDNEVVVMEYIEGKLIRDYIKDYPEKAKSVLLDLLNQMNLLDRHNVQKQEMVNPYKHIIVRDDKPVLIDFERMRKTEGPSNVTQFLQFVSNLGLISRDDVIKASKKYKVDYDVEKIIDIIDKI